MPRPSGRALSARKTCAFLLAASLLPASSPGLSPRGSERLPTLAHDRNVDSLIVIATLRLSGGLGAPAKLELVAEPVTTLHEQSSGQQAPASSTGQQITLADNGNPIAGADVALVLANMNKVSLGKTDAQGKTAPPPEATNPSPGNDALNALNLANLGKVELHAEVDECANGKKQVYDWPRVWQTVRRHQPHAVIFSDAGGGS